MHAEHDFFISYTKADLRWAEWIAWHLEEAGFKTVLQAWDFRPGSNFVLEMQKAAQKAQRTVMVLSPDYLNSLYTQPEWTAAFAKDPTGEKGILVPVRVRPCDLEGMLPQIIYIDLVELEEKAAREALLMGIERGRLKPTSAPAFPPSGMQAVDKQPKFPGTWPIKSPPISREQLAECEKAFRLRIRERFKEDAPYYTQLAVETTESTPILDDEKVPRSARRCQQRILAEYCEWIPVEREIKRVKLNTLREAVDKYPCVILLGDPGCGKTTALEYLAYELADDATRLPLPLRLSEFSPGLSVEDFIVNGWAGPEASNHWGTPELADNLKGYLDKGRLFCLFDALNEMAKEGYTERAQFLRAFIDQWSPKGNRFLITCRVLDYGEELSGLQRVEIQPLSDDQIKGFVQNELPETWETLWKELSKEIDGDRSLLKLARNPYMLTVMIDVYRLDGQLGPNRSDLMRRFSEILMGWTKEKSSKGQWIDANFQREALGQLAFEVQDRAGFGTFVKTVLAKEVMPKQVQPDPKWPPVAISADQVLNLAASAHIIEMTGDRSSLRFYHQLLQEYYAGREMLKRDPATLVEKWRWPWLEIEMPKWVRAEHNWADPLPLPPLTGWEETTILAAGLTLESDDRFVKAIAKVNPVIAARCLHEGSALVSQTARKQVIEGLMTAISSERVSLLVRNAAGELLGNLGDPRLGEFVDVPSGRFPMGDNSEKPNKQIFLREYQIGKHPLTNSEFAEFIKAGGYEDSRWWSTTGWEIKKMENWRMPNSWDDKLFNKPNQPLVGVSWYEGQAYCRWRSSAEGRQYRLPSEAEWEKAARGTDGRLYPWGNNFEANKSNSWAGKQSVLSTTPVGIYPGGASPYGCLDMAGNVWEWMEDDYNENYKSTSDDGHAWIQKHRGSFRVLRGGSWGDNALLCRSDKRMSARPEDRNSYVGFRLAKSP
jgi:formylglycine-generating enzyme required for sulfatase activity